MEKQTATLTNWDLHRLSLGVVLTGIVSGHPKLPDDSEVRTSLLKHLIQKEDGTWEAETLNTIYQLR